MILLDKVATKVHLTYDDGGENHKERVLVYIGVGKVGLQYLDFAKLSSSGLDSYSMNDPRVRIYSFILCTKFNVQIGDGRCISQTC